MAVSVAAIVAAAFGAASASAASHLEWTLENAYSSGCSATGLHCTWLGYMTNPTPDSGTRGTVSPIAPASGLTVTGAAPSPSLRGPNVFYTYSFPINEVDSTKETYDGGAATYEFEGGVSFESPAPPSGHGITITLEDPQIVVNGDGTGQLFASGLRAPGTNETEDYDRSQPVLNLDFGSASVQFHPDGSQSVVGIVPSIATAGHAFPANYAEGAGPDRDPNTFGYLTLRFGVDPDAGPTGPQGPAGKDGRDGLDGAAGKDGVDGKDGAPGPAGKDGVTRTVVERIQIAFLSKAPFGKKARAVRVLRRGKLVARGTIRGRRLRVKLTHAAGKHLRGKYVLRTVRGKNRAVIRLG